MLTIVMTHRRVTPRWSIESLRRRIARTPWSRRFRIVAATLGPIPGTGDEYAPGTGGPAPRPGRGGGATPPPPRLGTPSLPDYGLNFLTISIARGPISPARERNSFTAASCATLTNACFSSGDG